MCVAPSPFWASVKGKEFLADWEKEDYLLVVMLKH
jgi:hypothetical protein